VLLAIVALGLLVRLGLIVGGGGAAEKFEYDALAGNLLSQHAYVHRHLGTEYHAFYSGVPYVAIVALVYAVVPWGQTAILLVQSLFSAVLVVVVWRIGQDVANERVGLLAAALVAFHPGLIFCDTRKLHPLSFDALAIAAATFLAIAMRRGERAGSAALAGAGLALAIFQRPTAALLLPLLVALVWHDGGPARARRITAFVGATLLVLAPWLARNYGILGTPVLSTTAAESFWRGNAPHSFGSSYLPSGKTVLETADPALRAALRAADERGQSRIFLDAAVASARHDPLGFARGLGRKLLLFWAAGPQTGLRYPRGHLVIYLVYYVLMAGLAALGLWALSRRRDPAPADVALSTMLATICCIWIVQSLFYVETRHRWGVEPLMLVLSSAGAWSLARRIA
jgi:4-amino-4-deoxy-L-arabinose transferase-like glycosyltransferase